MAGCLRGNDLHLEKIKRVKLPGLKFLGIVPLLLASSGHLWASNLEFGVNIIFASLTNH